MGIQTARMVYVTFSVAFFAFLSFFLMLPCLLFFWGGVRLACKSALFSEQGGLLCLDEAGMILP